MNRLRTPRFRPVSLVGLVLVTTLGAATPAMARSNPSARSAGPVPLPTTGAYFGAYAAVDPHTGSTRAAAFSTFESEAGRKLALDRVFYFWDDVFPTPDDYADRDAGRILILSWSAFSADGTIHKWADIADGVYDADIDAKAAAISAFGAPMFFTFHHEPNNGAPGGGSAGTPQDFIDAWRHVHDRFIADGVTNVTFTLIFTAWTFLLHQADTWYPGDAYVDVLASDGYNWYNCIGHQGPWRSVQQIFQAFYNYGILHAKPMVVAEWGTGEDPAVPGRKAQWFTDGLAQFKLWPEIKGIAYYSNSPISSCARWIDTSASSLSAYQTIGADPYVNPTPLVTITSGPSDPTLSTSATFSWTAAESGSTFTCSLDGAAATACSSPKTYNGLSLATHTLSIVATDPGANTAAQTWTWTVTDLVTTITVGPASQTVSPTASFTFNASKPATFTCSLDGGAATACTSPKNYSGLLVAAHTFVVTANDGVKTQSATWSWTVLKAGSSVTVSDFQFSPSAATSKQGRGSKWTFAGPSAHTVTDSSGMGFFDSGAMVAGSTFTLGFVGAATYSYHCTIHPLLMNGTVSIAPVAAPTNGTVTTKFTITWASNSSPSGYTFDIQIFRPGGPGWVDWMTSQTVGSNRFTPDAGVGTYQFRARIHSSLNDLASGYSPAVTITVS